MLAQCNLSCLCYMERAAVVKDGVDGLGKAAGRSVGATSFGDSVEVKRLQN